MAVREEILEELHELQQQQAALARRQAELERKVERLLTPHSHEADTTLWGRWKDHPVSDADLEEARNSWNVHVEKLMGAMDET